MFGGFLPASFGTALFLIGQMSLLTYLPLYLKESMGFTAYWASQALAVAQGGAMIGRVGWGVASDRIFGGRRKIVLVIIGLLSVALSAPADRFSGRSLHRRLSRCFLCVDRRTGGNDSHRRGDGGDDNDQRRRGDTGNAAIRLHRRPNRFLRSCLA